MNWGNVIINKITYSGDIVTRLDGSLHLAGDPKQTDKKLTWLDGSAAAQVDAVPLAFIELDTLITVAKPEEGVDFESIVNPQTKFSTPGTGEAALRNIAKGTTIQISRRGFFIVDQVATPAVNGAEATPMQLIFIPDGRMKAMSTLSTKVDKGKGFGVAASKVAVAAAL